MAEHLAWQVRGGASLQLLEGSMVWGRMPLGRFGTQVVFADFDGPPPRPEREFFIDNLLVRIHFIIEMILVDRPCAMGV